VASQNLVDHQLSVSQVLFIQSKQVKVHESHRRTIIIICLYLKMLWIHLTESLICYYVINSAGYGIQQCKHAECVTLTLLPFNSLKQDLLCPVFSSYITYSTYMDQLKEQCLPVKLFQATHFSKKKPGSQGCTEALTAGRNMRCPSLMGPNGVDGGVI
jgi:hypothetical protein